MPPNINLPSHSHDILTPCRPDSGAALGRRATRMSTSNANAVAPRRPLNWSSAWRRSTASWIPDVDGVLVMFQ